MCTVQEEKLDPEIKLYSLWHIFLKIGKESSKGGS